MLAFQVHDRAFLHLQALMVQPHIQQALGKKAEHAAVIGRIGGNVQLFFQFKQDAEQPGGIGFKGAFAHEEHVETMPAALLKPKIGRAHV